MLWGNKGGVGGGEKRLMAILGIFGLGKGGGLIVGR